jgi:hypothetical protein
MLIYEDEMLIVRALNQVLKQQIPPSGYARFF